MDDHKHISLWIVRDFSYTSVGILRADKKHKEIALYVRIRGVAIQDGKHIHSFDPNKQKVVRYTLYEFPAHEYDHVLQIVKEHE